MFCAFEALRIYTKGSVTNFGSDPQYLQLISKNPLSPQLIPKISSLSLEDLNIQLNPKDPLKSTKS